VAWFCLSATLSAALHMQLSACFSTDCDCPPPPEHPEPQTELPVREVAAWTAAGDADQLPISFGEGTLSVQSDTVVIAYESEGMRHEIVYDVVEVR
jgi:hypothetical protein